MNYKGHIKKGAVVFDEPVVLPEGARVDIIVSSDEVEEALHSDILRFTGIIPEEIDAKREYREDMQSRQK